MKKVAGSTIGALVGGFLLSAGGMAYLTQVRSELGEIICALVSLAGAIIFAFACTELARAKGYTGGWGLVGLAGLLGVLGLISIVLLPDRMGRPVPVEGHWSETAATSTCVSLGRCPVCGGLVPRGRTCPACELRRLRPIPVERVVAAVLFMLAGLGLSVYVTLAALSPATYVEGGAAEQTVSEPAAPIFTAAAYLAITSGMSYGEVCALMGAEGFPLSYNTIAGFETVLYVWENPDGSNCEVMFQNGQAVQKTGYGLP